MSIEDMRSAEQSVVLESIKEVLWGGLNRQGLVYVTSETANQIKELTQIVNTISRDVSGDAGVKADMRQLKADFIRMQRSEERIERLESIKINLAEFEKMQAKEEREHDYIHLRITNVEKEIRDRSQQGMNAVAAWTGIVVSAGIGLIALFRGLHQ